MIHPSAYVHPEAKIGNNVTIEPFAYIAAKVTIGDGCWIGPHATICDGAILGRECNVHSGAVVSGIPQDLKFQGEDSTAEIGDRTTIRECATINRGTSSKGRTIIGSDCLVMAYAHVGHDCLVGNHCILVNNVSLGGEVEIGDWAIIAGHCAVHQFCRIGAHVMTGGGTMITKDVPPFIRIARSPASYTGINSVGLRRRGFTTEQITEIQDTCRIIFQKGLSYTNGCEQAESEVAPGPCRDMIIEFIRSSKRGLIKQYQPRSKDQDDE